MLVYCGKYSGNLQAATRENVATLREIPVRLGVLPVAWWDHPKGHKKKAVQKPH